MVPRLPRRAERLGGVAMSEVGAPGRDHYIEERFSNYGEDFQRHPNTGAPYVNHPTELTTKGRPAG